MSMNQTVKKMTLSEELTWRGFVNQSTLKDITALDENKLKFYHGFDASADSLTIGNLAAIMMDKVFIRHGYEAVILAGGATSLIGDPGGKDKERPLQAEETIHANVAAVKKELERLIGSEVVMVNNLDWFKKMTVVEYLRDVGKHFSMTPLVQRDYIAKRIGEDGAGITYTEFSYTLLQGYDFLKLYDDHGVALQLSGADQWGNCLSGIDLVRRVRGVEVNAYTCPLIINKATGKKFGKSEEGAVWLNAEKTSPTQMYQFWINVDDEGVEEYLKIYTELDKEEIDKVMHHHKEAPQMRTAQTRLAQEVTALVHGHEEMKRAEKVTELLVGKATLSDAGAAALAVMRHEQPNALTTVNGSVVEVLVSSGLAGSNTEARRLLAGNAISLNNQKITRENFEAADFVNGHLLLRKGKKFKDTALVELNG